jgi:hypothetical protein
MNEKEETSDLLNAYSKNLHFEFLDDRSWLPEDIKNELELTEFFNDIILSFLFKKRNGVIDDFFLKENKLSFFLETFMKKQNVTEFGYVEIIKKTDKYYKLKINDKGRNYFINHSTKYRVKSVTLIKRIRRYVLKLIRQFWSFIFVSANNRIKIIMESGIIKLILFIIAILSFILKDEIKDLILEWWKK